MVEAKGAVQCELLHAYKLQDYRVADWLSTLWQTVENSAFKGQLNEVDVIKRLKALLQEPYDDWVASTQESSTQEEEGKDSQSQKPSEEAQVQMMLQDEQMIEQ